MDQAHGGRAHQHWGQWAFTRRHRGPGGRRPRDMDKGSRRGRFQLCKWPFHERRRIDDHFLLMKISRHTQYFRSPSRTSLSSYFPSYEAEVCSGTTMLFLGAHTGRISTAGRAKRFPLMSMLRPSIGGGKESMRRSMSSRSSWNCFHQFSLSRKNKSNCRGDIFNQQAYSFGR